MNQLVLSKKKHKILGDILELKSTNLPNKAVFTTNNNINILRISKKTANKLLKVLNKLLISNK